MACTVDPPPTFDEIINDHKNIQNIYKEKANEATRLLCYLIHFLQDHLKIDVMQLSNQELKSWWLKHKEWDKQREKKEFSDEQ